MWHLQKIPKTVHFYWGNDEISFLRYLTIFSFKKFNPDWQINLYYPKQKYRGENTWKTKEHCRKFSGKNYMDKLLALEINKIEVDFAERGFDRNIPEAFKSDFLRWNILSKEGGLWSDCDIIYFKSMDSLYFNISSNRKLDTIVCISESKENCYHSIGFLLSSAGNGFFTEISSLASGNFDVNDYQSIGAVMLNSSYPSVDTIKVKFPVLNIHNIKMETVYPVNRHCIYIPALFPSYGLKGIPQDAIGLHWYAGYPYGVPWETIITEENYKDLDHILPKLISTVF